MCERPFFVGRACSSHVTVDGKIVICKLLKLNGDSLIFRAVATAVITSIGIIASIYFSLINRPEKKQLRYQVMGERVVPRGVSGSLQGVCKVVQLIVMPASLSARAG